MKGFSHNHFDRSMNNQRLHRANSFIRARKERAGIAFIKQVVIRSMRGKNLKGFWLFLNDP
jgi:hypothetical protein